MSKLKRIEISSHTEIEMSKIQFIAGIGYLDDEPKPQTFEDETEIVRK